MSEFKNQFVSKQEAIDFVLKYGWQVYDDCGSIWLLNKNALHLNLIIDKRRDYWILKIENMDDNCKPFVVTKLEHIKT